MKESATSIALRTLGLYARTVTKMSAVVLSIGSIVGLIRIL